MSADSPSSLSESVSTYPRLGKVVGSRIRLIQDSARLLGTRQPCMAPYKSGGRQDRLVCRKTRLTAEPLDLSMARQAYPPPADVIGKPTSLSEAKQACRPPGQGCRRQDNVSGSQDNVIRGKSRLPAGKQGCLAADKFVSLPTSLRRASAARNSSR